MTDKKNHNDNYELPTGIILPKDNSSDYPNWKKGIIFGIPGGFFGAFALWLMPTSKVSPGIDYTTLLFGFIAGYLLVGIIIAFRPPKN